MFKLILLITSLIVIILLLSKKIARNLFDTNLKRLFFYMILFIFFISSIYSLRFSEDNSKGRYNPPAFDGEKVVPGNIIND